MKWLLFFSVSFALAGFPARGEDLCHFVFRNNANKNYTPDLDKIERLNRLEEWSGRLRTAAYKDDPFSPTASRKTLKIFEKVEESLLKGDSSQALTAYRTLFRRAEGSALVIERYSALEKALVRAKEEQVRDLLPFLERQGVLPGLAKGASSRVNHIDDLDRELQKVQKLLRGRYRAFGKDFEEYNYARRRMESLSKAKHCSPVCSEAIGEFQRNAGLFSELDRNLYRELIGNRRGYALDEVRSIFNSHPEAALAARKKEFFQEGFALAQVYAGNARLMNRLYTHLAKNDWEGSRKLIAFFKSFYDKRYKDVDGIIARRIAYSQAETAKKFEIMTEQTQHLDRELFWLNFSRSVEGEVKKAWEELLEFARKGGHRFLGSMEASAQLAKKLGPVDQQKLRGVKRLFAAAAGGTLAWSYINFERKDELDEYDEPYIPFPPLNPDETQDEDDVELIDYLSKNDEEITQALGVLFKAHSELN